MGILRIFWGSQCWTLNGHISITCDRMQSWFKKGGYVVKSAVLQHKLLFFSKSVPIPVYKNQGI